MTTYWNFPSATGGMINSINNAGLETFRGNAIDALTREICQNSLDAVKENTQPVMVEFKSFTISSNRFPNRYEIIDVFNQCEQTWRGNNKKSEDFIQDALAILNRDEINFLRISDYNTKGLEGAKEGKLGSPWSSLIKEAGSSNKGESSGGSFGIGKSAPFLNSNLRTLFYSSFDVTGYESHIGVANIMSYQTRDNKITLGNGYFTNNPNSFAIHGQLILDKGYKRESTGTDIYVSAFEPKGNWEAEIKHSILKNFFITIFNNKLVVKINGFEINQYNIGELIHELEDNEENQFLKNYFTVLTSEKAFKILYPEKRYSQGIHFNEGEATLYLINGEDLNRRVLMTRKTGMRIFEQKNINGSISFTGILMITGTNMNNIFKQLENPAHNEWAPERFEKDPKLAKSIFSELRKFIRDTVKSQFQEQITDEMDAVGLSDFLPDTSFDLTGSTKKTESLNSSIKSIVTKEVKQESKRPANRKGKETKDFEDQLAGEFGITPSGNEGGNGDGSNDTDGGNVGSGASNPGGDNEVNKDESGELDKKKERKPSKDPIRITQRYLCMDKSNGKYNFLISPTKTLASGRLVFKVVGEQSDYDLPIKNASTNDHNVTVEKVNTNTVYLQSLVKDQRFALQVDIDYSDYCVLEVELYEN
ncbi:hypothetical protein JOC85_001172 [Bacillus mesophilus]|uniref:hypothetical protein n=1 Tax=Bacillus mesophilus TaxID=1808955 RepID=UPI00195A0576|nr:hypothetical protein [Bacillus mesophilus]MBM7660405.1 hypothetical protein [Bacillus mesophilus]